MIELKTGACPSVSQKIRRLLDAYIHFRESRQLILMPGNQLVRYLGSERGSRHLVAIEVFRRQAPSFRGYVKTEDVDCWPRSGA